MTRGVYVSVLVMAFAGVVAADKTPSKKKATTSAPR